MTDQQSAPVAPWMKPAAIDCLTPDITLAAAIQAIARHYDKAQTTQQRSTDQQSAEEIAARIAKFCLDPDNVEEWDGGIAAIAAEIRTLVERLRLAEEERDARHTD